MKRYLSIAKSYLLYGAHQEIAYLGNFWVELLSKTTYIISTIIFIDLFFRRFISLGDYSKNDVMFVMMVGQLTFYAYDGFLAWPMVRMIEDVRKGSFDLTLLRPISAKFTVVFSSIRTINNILSFVSVGVLVMCLVDVSDLHLTISSVLFGLVVWFCGMLLFRAVMLLLALPVFTSGDATDMVNVSFSFFNQVDIPYDLMPNWLKILGFSFVPTLLATPGAAFVMLNKGPYLWLVGLSIVAGIFGILWFNYLWSKAMSNYSSASS